MNEHPRRLYASDDSPASVARASPTKARRIVVTLLTILSLGTVVVAIITLV